MPAQEPETDRPGSRPRRFQYSLRTLFILTTVLAVACAVFLALPVWIGNIVTLCMILSVPVALTAAVIYGGGRKRAFCIGALFPAGFWCLFMASSGYTQFFFAAPFSRYPHIVLMMRVLHGESGVVDGRSPMLVFLSVYLLLLLMNGLLVVFVRYMLEGRSRENDG